jgi:hypothetical membrane protein
MKRHLLLFGTLAGLLFFGTVYALAIAVPGYSHVSDTVSEIGQVGSPVERLFQVAMLAVDLCIVAFGLGLFYFARSHEASIVPAALVAYFGLMEIGLHVFPSPHPLHNVFGLSLTSALVNVSWLATALILISIFLNISPLFTRDLFPLEYYGIVQRSAHVLFFGWCAYVSIRCFLFSDSRIMQAGESIDRSLPIQPLPARSSRGSAR